MNRTFLATARGPRRSRRKRHTPASAAPRLRGLERCEDRLLLTFDLWTIDQMFSSADGKVQFVELRDPANGESHLQGHFISSQTTGNKFTFPANLPTDATANMHFLIGTTDYAKQPGAVTPDYTVPDNFFSVAGDTIDYADVNVVTFAAGQLPTDGKASLLFNSDRSISGTSATNSETNFAGKMGSVTVAAYVNLAPTIDPVPDPATIPPNSPQQTINLTGISAGQGETQKITVTATSDNTGLIPNPMVTYSSPNSTGTLAYTPVAGAQGTATVTVTVHDDGGTANGGVDTTKVTFKVSVSPAAPPTAQPDTFVLSASATSSGSGQTSVLANDASNDGHPQNLQAKKVSSTAHGSLTLAADGSFSFMPNSTFQGLDRFSYQVSEGTAIGNTVNVTLLSYHASLVDKLYHQVLHRSAEDDGLQFWTGLLDHEASLDVVASGIFNSVERLDPLVTQFYEKFLLRGTDPGGLTFWVGDWQRNGGPDHVVVNILASKEFLDDAGDTNDGFVTQLYQRFLGRAPEKDGFSYWTGLLNSGKMTTGQVAAAFQVTHEQHVNLVDFLYGEYFNGTTPTPAQAQPYVADLDAGKTETQIELEIIDSLDYRNTPPVPAPGTVGQALYPH